LTAKKPWIDPIPGTTDMEHLSENMGSLNVELTPADIREIETAFSLIEINGCSKDATQKPQIVQESSHLTLTQPSERL
jgi:diketogulonate reductase-like aldo/keto reductase